MESKVRFVEFKPEKELCKNVLRDLTDLEGFMGSWVPTGSTSVRIKKDSRDVFECMIEVRMRDRRVIAKTRNLDEHFAFAEALANVYEQLLRHRKRVINLRRHPRRMPIAS